MKEVETILVNAFEKKVEKVKLASFSDIYTNLKCKTFCLALTFQSGIVLYVDDNGYLTEPKRFFKLKSHEPMQWLAGNGLFLGEDDEGNLLGCDWEIGEIEKDIVFMQCDDEESCPKIPPPRIISF